MLPRSGLRLAGLLALVVIALAGCGTIVNQQRAEQKIEVQLEDSLGIGVESVSCPADVDVESGTGFRCEVNTRQGTRLNATVKIRNDDADLAITSVSEG